MKTYTTPEAVIEAGLANDKAQTSLEIILANGETAYLNVACGEAAFREAVRRQPVPAIKSIVRAVAELSTMRQTAAAAALEAAVPGLAALSRLRDLANAEEMRYTAAFERMMDRGTGIAPKPVDQSIISAYSDAKAANPRAALYLAAESQKESVSWVDNTGKGAAGARAMKILAQGGTIEDAKAALAVRRNLVD